MRSSLRGQRGIEAVGIAGSKCGADGGRGVALPWGALAIFVGEGSLLGDIGRTFVRAKAADLGSPTLKGFGDVALAGILCVVLAWCTVRWE